MKILVVDDEQDICEILQFNLETEGYEVETANSAEEALEMILNPPTSNLTPQTSNPHSSNLQPHPSNLLHYDLILLDVMMGEMSGFQMARKLKDNRQTANIPIIFITALDGEDNTVKGLNIGADDYIAKPLSMKEVKARVKAVLRRTMPHTLPSDEEKEEVASGQITYEGLTLDLNAKIATLNNRQLSLTKLEFEILSLLLKNRGKVFSREDLLDRCWPSDTIVLDRTVDVNITRLRKKIGEYGKHVKTRFGYGYTFER